MARHLAPEGRFLFNLPHPTCDFLQAAARTGARRFGPPKRHDRADGEGCIAVERLERADLLAQTIDTTLRFTAYDADEQVVDQRQSGWQIRYLFPWEAVHLLYRCGLQVEELAGGYQGQPLGEGGQLVFQARLGR